MRPGSSLDGGGEADGVVNMVIGHDCVFACVSKMTFTRRFPAQMVAKEKFYVQLNLEPLGVLKSAKRGALANCQLLMLEDFHGAPTQNYQFESALEQAKTTTKMNN